MGSKARPRVDNLRQIARYFRCALSAVLILGFFPLPAFSVVDDHGPDDPMAVQDPMREDLSSKSYVQLIEMERDLKTKLGLEPGDPDLYYKLSAVYATLFDRTRTQKGNQSLEWIARSRDALDKVLMARPKDRIAHYNLGVVYKRLGQMERSREELRKAIQLADPKQDTYLLCASWLQIGSVYEEQGFYQEAKEAYLKAREFDYENPDIQEALRNVEAKRKAPEQGGGTSLGVPMMGNSLTNDPKTAAAMGLDPNAQSGEGGIAQALPALGQALMQKFGGRGGDSSDANE